MLSKKGKGIMKTLENRLPWFRLALAIAMAAILPASSSPATGGEPAGSNLALGKKCAFSPRPNYRHCTDAGDADQLTDGKTTNDYFWTQQGTVGWSGAPLATIRVDLGRVEPIGGVALRTAAGRADVTWPMAVYVLVSDDGKTYRRAGDLVALHEAAHGPLPDDYAIVRLEGSNLRTRGRYVQLVMVPLPGDALVPPMRQVDIADIADACKERLAKAAGGFAESGLAIDCRVTNGVPFMEILRISEELGADLIVMGTHGRGGLAHIMIGSVAERVVRKARCPVLTVKRHVA